MVTLPGKTAILDRLVLTLSLEMDGSWTKQNQLSSRKQSLSSGCGTWAVQRQPLQERQQSGIHCGGGLVVGAVPRLHQLQLHVGTGLLERSRPPWTKYELI